jgi:Cu(I)/Ag(I) efflux system membrane fusion protein
MTKKILAILALVIATATALYFYFSRPAPLSLHAQATGAATPESGAEKFQSYVCPMHPEITQDHPGTCPICGMKLVESNSPAPHEHGVHVDSATVQRLGIRIASAKRGMIGQDILAYGNVIADERAQYTVHTRYDGWIRKLHIHSVGERVKADQVIYEIYSPDLITRERTYLGSIDRRKQLVRTINTTPDTESEYVMELTMDAINDRLRLHSEEGVSLETLQLIEGNKQPVDVVKISTPRSGVVTQINVREGSYVSTSMPLFTLTDVSRVWVDVILYPDQVGMVKPGDPVTVQVQSGEPIKAKLDFISAVAENNRAHARVYLDNANVQLRPGTYADVSIVAHPREALILPRSAIIYTAHGNLVMLSRGDGHFLPVPVETGSESGDCVEILSGLKEGAEVAANGQFLLDAASSMNAAAQRLQESHAH